MLSFGDVLLLALLAFILFLAIAAIIHGKRGMKVSKGFEGDKKLRYGYWALSCAHFVAGILITTCYAIAAIVIAVGLINAAHN